ncbi:isoprenylcysteine carboxylmethyltransferase family protein [bacterium]|nr:isoprenylcysteine carboxylmethyltransferase family protein [bacterium]
MSLKAPHHYRQQIGGALFFGLVLFSKSASEAPGPEWIFHSGLALFLAGLLGRVWSSGYLVKNDQLTTTGPYGLVRNPIYVSNMLLAAGLVLLSGLFWAIVLVLALYVVCYVPGMRAEEENLRRRFGAAFDQYAAAVPLIVPALRTAAGYGGDRWRVGAYLENKEWAVTAGLVAGLALIQWRRING